MARCPSCNKFCGLEDQEPQINSSDITEEGEITAEIYLERTSSCCGDTVKEATFEITGTIEDPAFEEHMEKHGAAKEEVSLSISSEEASINERYQDKDAKGKKIPYRFQKHFYSATYSGKAECSCGEEFEFSFESDEIQASAMEEVM